MTEEEKERSAYERYQRYKRVKWKSDRGMRMKSWTV